MQVMAAVEAIMVAEATTAEVVAVTIKAAKVEEEVAGEHLRRPFARSLKFNDHTHTTSGEICCYD